jgi:transcriptional regulator with XRE-family HTH domain
MVDINKQALQIIKNKAKSQGLTQNDLAEKLGVSLPTIKRWYAGGTITLESLKLLVNQVGLSLTEVFSSIEESTLETFHYTEDQEYFFSTNPAYLAYFDNLLIGNTPSQIQKKFHMSEKKTVQYLSKLDKLKLIEWLPKNKVRFLVKGEPVWKSGGPLAVKLRNDIFKSFLENEKKSEAHFFLHDYLDEDRKELFRKIQDVVEFAKRANRRAKFSPDKAKPSGIYLSLQNFRWEVDKYLVED